MPRIELRWPWPTWEWQVKATTALLRGIRNLDPDSESYRRIRKFVWVISRQQGKTALLQAVVVKFASMGGEYAYFAPAYDRAEKVYDEVCTALRDVIDAGLAWPKKLSAGWWIKFSSKLTGGAPGLLHFKSLGNPEHLRGMTLNGCVVDEAGLVEGKVWRKIIRPMLVAKDGWAIFSGTPPEVGEAPDPDFFKGLKEQAETGDPAYWYIHRDYTSHAIQRVREDIEAERALMPAEEFAREYLALFPEEEEYRLPSLRWWGPGNPAVFADIPGYDEKAPCHVESAAEFPYGTRIATGIDLADNDQQIGDKAAVVTWAVLPGGYVLVLAGEYYRNPSEVLEACYQHVALWGSEYIGVQKTSFDKGFVHTVAAAAPSRGFALPIAMQNIGGASKRRRIMQLEPIARAGKLFVHERLAEFMLEWEQFPDGLSSSHGDRKRNTRTNHYDQLDAFASGGVVSDQLNFATQIEVCAPRKDTARAIMAAIKAQKTGRNWRKVYNPGIV
ncbi:MAG: hypothetical protein GY820_39530 [Gammaproteobacteria bacterium]|nr:hypothetical protein [Gammaproteobacteria bacterium]